MLRTPIYSAVLAASAALGASFIDCPSAHAQNNLTVSANGRARGPSLGAIGLGLFGGGLLTSAPGIAILAACKEGKPCHSDATTVLGWLLVGPGIPPILLGMLFVSLDKPNGRISFDNAPSRPPPLQIAATPLPSSGGMVSVRYSF